MIKLNEIKQILHVAFKQMQNDYYNELNDMIDNYDINIVDYTYNAKKIIDMCNDNNYHIKYNECVTKIIDKKYKYNIINDFDIYDDDLIYIIDENNVLLFVVNDYFDICVNENIQKCINEYNNALNVCLNTNIYNDEYLNNILNDYNFKSNE